MKRMIGLWKGIKQIRKGAKTGVLMKKVPAEHSQTKRSMGNIRQKRC